MDFLKNFIIIVLITVSAVLGILYTLKECPKCEECKKCEECPKCEECKNCEECKQYLKFDNTDYAGYGLKGGVVGSFETCKESCEKTSGCNGFVIDSEESKYCFLKTIPQKPDPKRIRYDTKWRTYYAGFSPLSAAPAPQTS